MLSVIIGDIVGSRFEFMPTREKDVQLFHPACCFTDDTVCNAAITDANLTIADYLKQRKIIEDKHGDIPEDFDLNEFLQKTYIKRLVSFCKDYPMAGYGKGFFKWVNNPEPYNSNGNGALMRVSSVSLIFDENIEEFTEQATAISHNHPETLLYTKYYSQILFLFKKSCMENKTVQDKKEMINLFIKEHSIEIKSVQEYSQLQGYHVFSKPTLERALASWLEADNFEDTLKNALYIGSDTDTTCAIASTFAEYTWGIEKSMLEQLYRYFDFKNIELLKIVCRSYKTSNYWNILPLENQNYINHIIDLKLEDPTASYDALQIPSDEDYYKGKIPPLILSQKIKKWLNLL